MATTLGGVIREARERKLMTLRQVEEVTGIRNAHLSQIETGTITKPSQVMLWTLAGVLDLDYERLLDLAGHTSTDGEARVNRQRAGALLRGLEELDEEDQRALLNELEKLRRMKKRQ